jgi:hypothetical protein
MSDHEIVFFEFGRHRIDAMDFSLFFHRYVPEKWPTGTALRKQLGSLMITFHGYDADERELQCIPEVRRFVKEFRRIWPFWLYFLCPVQEVSTLPTLVACCVSEINVIQVAGSGICAVDFDPQSVKKLLDEDVPWFKQAADRANLFPALRRRHLTQVYALFGLKPDEAALAAAGAVCAS